MNIYFIRHGETQLNKQKRSRGWLNVPLSSKGVSQAVEISKKMAKVPLDAIYTSDMDRARHTADIVGASTGTPVIADQRLRPWHTGELAGQLLSDASPVMKAHLEQYPDIPMPGGGESYNEFASRMQSILGDIKQRHGDMKNVAIVASHSNVLSLEHLLDGKQPKFVEDDEPAPGSITKKQL